MKRDDLDWPAVREIARVLGVKDSAFEWWQKRGVPFKHWYDLQRLSKGKITIEALQRSRE